MALHAEFRFGVRLFREPDAGNPPVRFDEREEETEPSQTGLRRRGESPVNRHREATVTAPLLDSTHRGASGVHSGVSAIAVITHLIDRFVSIYSRVMVTCSPEESGVPPKR